MHFIEYGLIAFLFYRAWRPAADISVIVLPILAGIVVGTIEEWFQWFIPNRVGELRDVALNLVAVVCGLMISVAIVPPARVALSLSARVAPAGGGRPGVRDRSPWRFLSIRFISVTKSPPKISASVPTGPRPSSRRCRPIARRDGKPIRRSPGGGCRARTNTWMKGLWHARRRNQRWDENDHEGAWQENRILEIYFAPVLDTPSYVSGGHRWPAAHTRRGPARLAESNEPYTSDAQPYPIVLVPRWLWRLGAVVALAAIAGLRGRAPINEPAAGTVNS